MLISTMSLNCISERIEILNKEMVLNNEFSGMCVKEHHDKHNDHQSLKKKMDEMRVRKADLVKKIRDLEIKNLDKEPSQCS